MEASWRAISSVFGDELAAIMRRFGARFGGKLEGDLSFGGELGVSQRAIGRRFGGRLNFEGELEAIGRRLGGRFGARVGKRVGGELED